MQQLPQLLLAPQHASLKPDKVVVLVSDTELGAGDICDAFRADKLLAEVIRSYTQGRYDKLPVDFIFNGDNFDFLKVKVGDKWPRHITADIALKKLALVSKAHRGVFAAMRDFVLHKSGNKNLYFVVGNHDQELLFPEVQEKIKALIGSVDRVRFADYAYNQDRVYATHGQQHDETFRMNLAEPFMDYHGEKILNLPFMSYAIMDSACPLKEVIPDYEQVKPYEKLFTYYPLARKAILRRAARYTAKAIFIRPFTARSDFTLQLPRAVKKQWLRRLLTGDYNVHVEDEVVEEAKKIDAEVVLLGHLHDIEDQVISGVRLLKVGTFRDEYGIKSREEFYSMPKSYAEVLVKDNHPIEAKIFSVIDETQPVHKITTYKLLESGAIK